MKYLVPTTPMPAFETTAFTTLKDVSGKTGYIPFISACCEGYGYELNAECGLRSLDAEGTLSFSPMAQVEKTSDIFLLQGIRSIISEALYTNQVIQPVVKRMNNKQRHYRNFAEIILDPSGLLVIFDHAGMDMPSVENDKLIEQAQKEGKPLDSADFDVDFVTPSQDTFELFHHAFIFDGSPDNALAMNTLVETLVPKYLMKAMNMGKTFPRPGPHIPYDSWSYSLKT